MAEYEFQTDDVVLEFINSIAETMIRKFGIPRNEAVGRINRIWRGLEFTEDDIIFREDEEFWANTIYYGKDSTWWLNPPNLKPLPYP